MKYIQCSADYAKSNIARKPKYMTESSKGLHAIKKGTEIPSDAICLIPASVSSSDVSLYLYTKNQIDELTNALNQIRAKISMDYEAYNSLGGKPESFTIQQGTEILTAQNMVTVTVVNQEPIEGTASLSDLIIEKPIEYQVNPAYKDILKAILQQEYIPQTPAQVLETIASTVKASQKTHRRVAVLIAEAPEADIVEIFLSTYGISKEQATAYANQYILAENYRNICNFADAHSIAISDFIAKVTQAFSIKTCQRVTVAITDD